MTISKIDNLVFTLQRHKLSHPKIVLTIYTSKGRGTGTYITAQNVLPTYY